MSFVFALGLGCPGSAQTPAGDAVPVDRTVTITYDGAKLVAEPEVFLARVSGPGIEFVVNGLPDKYTLEIDFRPQGNVKGPFVRTAGVRGRYEFVGTGQSVKAQSGGVDAKQVKAGSYWKYEVLVRDADRNDKAAIDPGGVFK